LVYQLTGSAFALGAIAFLEQVPNFLLVPITGGIIERLDRRKLLLATQILSLLHSLALTVLVFAHQVNLDILIVLSLFKGAVSAFDVTARQVFIAEIVETKRDRHQCPNYQRCAVYRARVGWHDYLSGRCGGMFCDRYI
jgi:MFS family permease